MKRLLIVDLVCPKPYTCASLESEALGGTEATIIRVMRALSPYFQITCLQRGRTVKEENEGIWFMGEPDTNLPYKPDAIISLRDTYTHKRYKAKYPDSKHVLWLHDLPTPAMYDAITSYSTVVCVSEYHRNVFRSMLIDHAKLTDITHVSSQTIYNPLAPGLKPDGTPVDPYKLVFFSSPHKGLEDTLKTFEVLHKFDSRYKLYVANPGYMASRTDLPSGVVNLGVLTHADVIKEVRSALCVFYLNRVFPETMGLVFAEANAVGTPVLTHPIGAAREILDHPYELIDTRDTAAVIQRVAGWSQGQRPVVRGRPEFSIGDVTKQWKRLLGASNL